MPLYLVLNDQSLTNLNQIYVPITFIEGIKILSFSLFYGLLIRSLFINFQHNSKMFLQEAKNRANSSYFSVNNFGASYDRPDNQ